MSRARDLEDLRNLMSAKLSDASIAQMMGRSQAWVARERAAIEVAAITADLPGIKIEPGLHAVELERAERRGLAIAAPREIVEPPQECSPFALAPVEPPWEVEEVAAQQPSSPAAQQPSSPA